MQILLRAEQQSALAQDLDDRGIGRLEELAGHRRDGRQKIAVFADGVQHRQAVALAELQVVLAVRRRDMHDARAVFGRHELGRPNAANIAGRRQVIEQPLVPHAVERVPERAADDFHSLVFEDGGDERLRKNQRFLAALHPRVLDVGVHGEQQVRRQRPRSRRPDQEIRVGVALHAEPNVNGRILDFAIALRDFVGRQRRADTRV